MSKVRISNALGTVENDYPGDVRISVDGQAWGPVAATRVDAEKPAQGNVAADTSASGNVAAGALLGGGSGGYAGGGVGGERPETVGQDVGRRFTYEYHGTPGGEYPLDYPDRNMYRALVHCNSAGLHIYGPFVPTAGRKPGPNIGAIKTAENLTGNIAGVMAIGPTKDLAGAIFSTRNMLTPNLTYVVDESAPDGVNVSLKSGEPYYVLVQVNTPTDYMLEPRAHNAG